MEENKDKIQYPPYSRWYFSPKTTGDPFLFAKEIIVSAISPLIKKEPFIQKDIYFSVFRYGERIELKVFASKEFSETIQEVIESCKNSSIIIEPGEEGSYFCTTNYCESTNQVSVRHSVSNGSTVN